MRSEATAAVAAGSSARDVLARLDRKAADRAVAARVDGKLRDLSAPIPPGALVEPVLPDSKDGLEVIRHSTAHLMAQAVQELFPGTQVTIGPVIEDGFYYDFVRPEPFTPEDLGRIEKKMKEIVSRNLIVTRHEMRKTEAMELFAAMGESYKVEILEGIPDDQVSVYQQGDWKDLCRGPHVPATGKLGAFKLTIVAVGYWVV